MRSSPLSPSPAMARDPLGELVAISRAVGSDPDLVQGGGGNTSVKSRDGRRMFVKASGTSLASMDRRRGWAELDLARLRAVLGERRLGRLPASRREAEVLRLLGTAVERPRGARPSVESSLHALLGRVVIHTHPVGLNALLSSRSSRERCLTLFGDRFGEPLYIPYVDPGYVLARRVEREIERYRKRTGRLPQVVLLANHGLFAAAEETDECLALSGGVCDVGRRFIGGGRVNPRGLPALIPAEGEEWGTAVRVREALARGGAALALVCRDGSPTARAFIARPRAVRAALRGAFTPDQIVYCRTRPLLLPRRPEGAEAVWRRWGAQAARAVAAYRRRRGLDPRVAVVPGSGVFYAAPEPGQLRIVAEVYRSAMAALLHSPRAGGPRFLTRRQAAFIEGWEVEAFRARLAAVEGL